MVLPTSGPPRPGGQDATAVVRAFYEACPFPDYDDLETVADLVAKAQRGTFASLLNDQIPFRTRVLDLGCGTGQLAIYLSLATRHVVGLDVSAASLRLGQAFARQGKLPRVRFVQSDLFNAGLRPGAFDYVIANGVLHHTADPAAALAAVSRLARPGGYVVVGLYNRYARLPLQLRGLAFRLTGGHLRWLDPVLRAPGMSEAKKRSWFRDQYQHPHEVSVSVDGALAWFRACGLRYVSALPPLDATPAARAKLFEPVPNGTRLGRLLRQLGWAFTLGREGGLFVLVGQKDVSDVPVAA